MQEMLEKLKDFAMTLMTDNELNELYNINLCDDGFGIQFTARKNSDFTSILNLHTIVARFTNGEKLEDVIGVIKSALLEQYKLAECIDNTTFETVKDTIFPQIKTTIEAPVELPKIKFDKDGKLSIFYVRDLGSCMVYIKEDNVKDWGVSLDELHALAVSNLEKKVVFPINMQLNGAVANFHVYNSKDGYDATRALILDTDVLKENFAGRVCIAMPNRDFLVVVDEKHYNLFAIKHQVIEDYNTKTYPVSSDIFVYTGGVWEVLK